MNKSDLIGAIQKYHLNGKCNDVRWEIANKSLWIDFLTDDGSMLGTVETNIDLPDNIFALFNTDKFVSMLNALGGEIQGQYKKSGTKTLGLTFTDGVVEIYAVTYELALLLDPKNKLESFRQRGRQLNIPAVPAIEITLNQESIDRFLRSRKALGDAKVVGLIQGHDSVEFVINYATRNDNKINVPFPCRNLKDIDKVFMYNIDYVTSVLSANLKFRDGSMIVTDDGMIIFDFKSEDYLARYYLKQWDA